MIFRYPGGKTSLLPRLAPVLDTLVAGQSEFHDAFVGGGSVLLHVAQAHPGLELFANDLDGDIAAFWRVVASHQVEALCEMMCPTPTIDRFYEVKASKPKNDLERGYRILFLNRTTFSGISHGHPIGGCMQEGQYKVFENWTGGNLLDSLRQAHGLLRGRLHVASEHAANYVRANRTKPLYADPPYFHDGGLYQVGMDLGDHLRLAESMRKAKRWVMSYNDTPAIWALYDWAHIQQIEAQYRVRQKKRACIQALELVIQPPHKLRQ